MIVPLEIIPTLDPCLFYVAVEQKLKVEVMNDIFIVYGYVGLLVEAEGVLWDADCPDL